MKLITKLLVQGILPDLLENILTANTVIPPQHVHVHELQTLHKRDINTGQLFTAV